MQNQSQNYSINGYNLSIHLNELKEIIKFRLNDSFKLLFEPDETINENNSEIGNISNQKNKYVNNISNNDILNSSKRSENNDISKNSKNIKSAKNLLSFYTLHALTSSEIYKTFKKNNSLISRIYLFFLLLFEKSCEDEKKDSGNGDTYSKNKDKTEIIEKLDSINEILRRIVGKNEKINDCLGNCIGNKVKIEDDSYNNNGNNFLNLFTFVVLKKYISKFKDIFIKTKKKTDSNSSDDSSDSDDNDSEIMEKKILKLESFSNKIERLFNINNYAENNEFEEKCLKELDDFVKELGEFLGKSKENNDKLMQKLTKECKRLGKIVERRKKKIEKIQENNIEKNNNVKNDKGANTSKDNNKPVKENLVKNNDNKNNKCKYLHLVTTGNETSSKEYNINKGLFNIKSPNKIDNDYKNIFENNSLKKSIISLIDDSGESRNCSSNNSSNNAKKNNNSTNMSNGKKYTNDNISNPIKTLKGEEDKEKVISKLNIQAKPYQPNDKLNIASSSNMEDKNSNNTYIKKSKDNNDSTRYNLLGSSDDNNFNMNKNIKNDNIDNRNFEECKNNINRNNINSGCGAIDKNINRMDNNETHIIQNTNLIEKRDKLTNKVIGHELSEKYKRELDEEIYDIFNDGMNDKNNVYNKTSEIINNDNNDDYSSSQNSYNVDGKMDNKTNQNKKKISSSKETKKKFTLNRTEDSDFM